LIWLFVIRYQLSVINANHGLKAEVVKCQKVNNFVVLTLYTIDYERVRTHFAVLLPLRMQ
jgi:hypothetical protein